VEQLRAASHCSLDANGRPNAQVRVCARAACARGVCVCARAGLAHAVCACVCGGGVVPLVCIFVCVHLSLRQIPTATPPCNLKDLKLENQACFHFEGARRGLQVLWFWQILRALSQDERSMVLQFVTGNERPPLTGFQALEYPFTVQVICFSRLVLLRG